MEILAVWRRIFFAPHRQELTRRHAMARRHRSHTDKRPIFCVDEIALDRTGANRIGAIDDIDFATLGKRRLRQKQSRIDKRIIPCADVLDIDDDDIEIGERFGIGAKRL